MAIYETNDYTVPLMLGYMGFINNKISRLKIELFLVNRVDLTDHYHQNNGSYNYNLEEVTCSHIETGKGFRKMIDDM